MKYFTNKQDEELQIEADAKQVPIESLLTEMKLPKSTLHDEKISYEQYLFIKSISNSAVKYGLFGLLHKDYEKEINLIDDTAEIFNSCVIDILNQRKEKDNAET